MAKMKREDTSSSVDLSWVDFWVLVLDVPFNQYTKAIGIMVGEGIGLVVDVDISDPSFHLSIPFNVTKPLRRSLYIDWEEQ